MYTLHTLHTLQGIGGHYLSLKSLKYFSNQGKKINITHSTQKITSKMFQSAIGKHKMHLMSLFAMGSGSRK